VVVSILTDQREWNFFSVVRFCHEKLANQNNGHNESGWQYALAFAHFPLYHADALTEFEAKTVIQSRTS
jgi:hypothetical protein